MLRSESARKKGEVRNGFVDKIRLYCVECGGETKNLVCSSCGKVYKSIEGIPCFLSSDDENSSLFKEYFDNYAAIARDDIEKDIMPVPYKNAQYDKLVRYCGRRIRGAVLDVGSGKGGFLKRVPHNNKIGVDIAMEYLRLLKNEGVDCILANAENMPFKESFDLVVATDILEHVLHPEKVLQSIHRALKVGGTVIIRTPYKENLAHYRDHKYKFVHLRNFDEESLVKIIKKSGLYPVKIYYDGFSYYKVRKDSKNPIVALMLRGVHKYFSHLSNRGLSFAENDAVFNRLPNWIGRLLFEPIEIVVVAKKRGQGGLGLCEIY